MKITKYGTVKISDQGFEIEGFDFDGEGEDLTLEHFAEAAVKWGIQRAQEELECVKVIDGGGNVVNDRPYLQAQ